jgi:hypothetical protein
MIALALAIVVTVTLAIIAVGQSTKPKGPPSAPRAVQGVGSVCAPPDCHVLAGDVMLSWSPPASGSPVTGYDVYRDDLKITTSPLASAATSYDDPNAGFGTTRNYQVVARSTSGNSARSAEAQVKVPLPPDRFAQLSGVFKVHLTVVRASNLAKAEGINQPTPGDSISATWQFAPTCGPNSGPCTTKLGDIVLHTRGRAYAGANQAGEATCFSAGKVPVHFTMRLVPTRAALKSLSWVYTAFTGTRELSFSCPGSPVSSATFKVTAKFAPGSGTSPS